MKIRLSGPIAARVKARLEAAALYFETPATYGGYLKNQIDPVTGQLLSPEFPEGERVYTLFGLVPIGGRTIYRNCYGETLALFEQDGSVLLTGRRHQSLYGAPRLCEEPENAVGVEVIETSRPDLAWWETAT